MPTAKKTKNKKKKKTARNSILFGLLILILLFLIDSQIRPIITAMSSYYARQYAIEKINLSIETALNMENISYDNLVTLQTDGNGSVTSIQTNTKEIARIHTLVVEQVNQALSELNTAEFSIPIGSLTGVVWLSGVGPSIPIKMLPRGVANAQVLSQFSEAGINQTLHQLTLHITAELAVILPGYPSTVEIESDYLLAESIVVGTVPKYYTKVLSGESENDVTGDVNKYGNPKFLGEKEAS